MKRYLLIYFLFCGLLLQAQCSNTCGSNLLPNPGFEIPTGSCSTSDIQLYNSQTPVQGWYGTDNYPGAGSSPDYFSPCAGITNSANSNCFNGTARVGIFTKTSFSQGREYIQAQLTAPLVAGKTYCFSMVVKSKVGSAGNILSSCDGIGAWIHNQGLINIQTMNGGNQFLGPGSTVNATPQIENPSGNLIGSACVIVTGTFCAQGDESWIVIGNFKNDANTQMTGSNPSNYMYVEDATLLELCPPTIDLQASPLSINCGSSTTLTTTSTFPTGSVYNWIAPAGNTLSGTGPITVSPGTTTTYTIVATFTNSCGVQTDTSSVTVVVGPCGINATVSDTTICAGQCHNLNVTNVLGGQAPYSFNWTDENDNSIGNTPGPIQVCPPSGTFYVLHIIDANGETFEDTATITVVNYPVVTTGNDTTICAGGSASLVGTTDSGQPFWIGLGSGNTFNVSPNSTTTYVFTSNLSGCVTSDSTTITVEQLPVFSTGSSNITCFGYTDGEAWVSPAGTYSVVWSPNNVASDSIHNLSAGNYTVTVNTTAGCSVTSSLNITAPSELITTISGNTALCSGSVTTLQATSTGGVPGYSYLWSNGEITPGISVSPNATSTVHLTTTDANGCTDENDIPITVNPIPQALFANDIKICAGTDTIVLNLSAGATNYQWIVNGASGGSSFHLPFNEQVPGCYDVLLIATNSIGCSDTIENSCAVTVFDVPDASVFVTNQSVTIDNPVVSFINNSTNAAQCSWYVDGHLFHTGCEHNLTHTFEQLGTYQVTLVTTNEAGCTDSVMLIVEVHEGLIYYVPNAFTPDGDEFNNTFQPVFSSGFDPYSYHLSIYDRWGERLFESYDYQQGWDGTYQGKISMDGVYTWTIQFKDLNTDKAFQVDGSVTIIR